MPTGDLINIFPLVLSDTYQTWFDRTNQLISSINPLQVYDIVAGSTGGLYDIRGGTSSYNGVVTIGVQPGPGIGTRTYSGVSKTIVDYALFDSSLTLTGGASGNSSSVAVDDEYIVNDVSDTTDTPAGKAKKVKAKNMLPPYVEIPSFTLNGDLVVNGNIYANGDSAFIAETNLRIEDTQIELAYQQSLPLTVTGVTGGSFTYTGAAQSLTGYYAMTAAFCNAASADVIGYFHSYTGSTLGPTGTINFGGPYVRGSATNVGTTGYIKFDGFSLTASIVAKGTLFNDFLNDTLLSEGGIVLKGASGDKQFLWINNDNSGLRYNGWISNTNLGVSGADSYVISRNFRSYGYSGGAASDSQFFFLGEQYQDVKFAIGENQGGEWEIKKFSGTGATNQDLVFSFGQTGSSSLSRLFSVSPTAAGHSFTGVTATSFATGFNSDQLDGAHASLTPSPYTIPIGDSNGKITTSWLEAEAIVHRINITAHGFVTGDVVRVTSTGNYVKAIATSAIAAEAVGMVSEIPTANQFVLTQRGRITGLTGYSPGEVYFLSGTVTGGLISDPSVLSASQIRKPMFLAHSATAGYVLNYVGTQIFQTTDEVYLPGLVPIGTIYPYTGPLAYLTGEWLICDGDRYTQAAYPDLYQAIGNNTYFAEGTATNGSPDVVITGGIRNIAVGDTLRVYESTGTTYLDLVVSNVTSLTRTVTFTTNYTLTSGTVKVYAKTDSLANNIFFVPDLRTRVILGASTGDSAYSPLGITLLDSYAPGDAGGTASVTLTASNIPPHAHSINTTSAVIAAGSNQKVFGTGSTELTNLTGGSGGAATPFSNIQPYLSTHYIIRATKSTPAIILTGHNHDNRYIRFDAAHTSSGPTALTAAGRTQFRTNAYVSGLALGSLTSATGDYHDHDGRYVRFDIPNQGLTQGEQYSSRLNSNSSPRAEGDGFYSLGVGATLHNHDLMYVRYDTVPQTAFGSVENAYFLNKINVYSKSETYSRTEQDGRFVNVAGDVMTGTLEIDSELIVNDTVSINADVLAITANSDSTIKSRTTTISSFVGTSIAGPFVYLDGDINVLRGNLTVLPSGKTLRIIGTQEIGGALNPAGGLLNIGPGGNVTVLNSSLPSSPIGVTFSGQYVTSYYANGAQININGGGLTASLASTFNLYCTGNFRNGANLGGKQIVNLADADTISAPASLGTTVTTDQKAATYGQVRKGFFVGAFAEPSANGGFVANPATIASTNYQTRQFDTNPAGYPAGFNLHGVIMIRVEDQYRNAGDPTGRVDPGCQNILHFPFPFFNGQGQGVEIPSDENFFTVTGSDGSTEQFPYNSIANLSNTLHTSAEGYALYKLNANGGQGDLFLGVDSARNGASTLSFKFFKRNGSGFTGDNISGGVYGQKIVRFVVMNREHDVGAAIYG